MSQDNEPLDPDQDNHTPEQRRRWLDGLTPDEQLEEIDFWETYVRDTWAKATTPEAKAMVYGALGDLDNRVAHYEGLRKRIRAGLPPLGETEEERAERERIWAEIDESLAKKSYKPFPPHLR